MGELRRRRQQFATAVGGSQSAVPTAYCYCKPPLPAVFLFPVRTMAAAALATVSAFEQEMFGKNPISFFGIIVHTLHQRFGLSGSIVFFVGRHEGRNAVQQERFFSKKKCGRNLASVRTLCHKAMPSSGGISIWAHTRKGFWIKSEKRGITNTGEVQD